MPDHPPTASLTDRVTPLAASRAGAKIVIEGVSKSFAGRRVVDVEHLVLGDHPVEGLIGPNGAGKTTLVRLIMGSLPVDSGEIFLEPVDGSRLRLTGLPSHRVAQRGVVKTNQVVTDFVGLTILDSLLLAVTERSRERPYRLLGERSAYAAHRGEIHRLLEHFEIDDPRRLALSAGEKKVVDIMRCLLLRPKVFLLDEPTAGLTGEMTSKVMAAVRELAEAGTAVVIIEHDLDVIWSLSSQVTFMAEGQVLLQGDPGEIRAHETVVESYLGRGHV